MSKPYSEWETKEAAEVDGERDLGMRGREEGNEDADQVWGEVGLESTGNENRNLLGDPLGQAGALAQRKIQELYRSDLI